MDRPHPLETLAEPGAYLDSGSISRMHNPDHYKSALGRIAYLMSTGAPPAHALAGDAFATVDDENAAV